MTAGHSHHYVDHSTVVSLARRASDQLRAWIAASWLARLATRLGTAVDDATRTSRLAAALRTLERFVRNSYCYRWLTKEPDPEVIIIDLRETYAVGPFIALLDRVAPALERTWRGSHARNATEALRTTSKRRWVEDSRSVQLLAAALEPPEPPEKRQD